MESGELMRSWLHLGGEQILHMTAGQDGTDTVTCAGEGRRTSSERLVDVAFEGALEGVKLALTLGDLATQGLVLGLEEPPVEGDQDRALHPENLLVRAVGPDCRQLGLVQSTHLLAVNGQEFRMLGGHQRTDEMERPLVDGGEVLLGVVALVENQRDVACTLPQFAAAPGEFGRNGAKGLRVMLVTSIDMMEQRDIPVRGDEQGETDQAQIGASLFAVSSLRKGGVKVETIDEGEEVGGIEEQAAQIEAELSHGSGADVAFNRADRRLVDAVHVVPEALARQLRRTQVQQTRQDGRIEPRPDAGLAPWRDAAVKQSHEQVLADRGPLRALLGHVVVDDADQVQPLGHGETGGRGTQFANDGLLRGGVRRRARRKAASKVFGGPEVLLPDNRGFAVDALALPEVVVGLAMDELLREARHA